MDDGDQPVTDRSRHRAETTNNPPATERVLGRREVPAGPVAPNQTAWVEYQPYGVVGVIGPGTSR